MQHTIRIASTDDLNRAADEFVRLMDSSTVYAFNGEMGAGKPPSSWHSFAASV